jgi:hypothetical protein
VNDTGPASYGMHLDSRQIPGTLMEPAMDAGYPADPPGPRDPLVDSLAAAVRETGTALKPGDVLAVRLPLSFSVNDVRRAQEHAKLMEQDTGVKVLFVPGEEFAHVTVNVTVNGFAGSQAELAAQVRALIRSETAQHARTSAHPAAPAAR